MVKNNRIPLPLSENNSIQLTDSIRLLRLLSDCGGSSLTYLGEDKAGKCIVKEIYPVESKLPLSREQKFVKIDGGTTEQQDELRVRLAERAKEEAETARKLYQDGYGEDGGTNSIFSFGCEILNPDELQEEFRGTAAQYLVINTCTGLTMDEYVKRLAVKSPEYALSLEQALTLTDAILQSVQFFHEKQKMLHLDLKPDNCYFPTQLEHTFAILLDCGSAQPIDQAEKMERISVSAGYTSYEVKQLASNMKNMNQEEEGAYRKLIGPHSDLASVGYILFHLLLKTEPVLSWIRASVGNDEAQVEVNVDSLFWGLYQCSLQSELEDHLHQYLLPGLEVPYPYLAERICRMVSRAVYIPEKMELSELRKGRFENCKLFRDEIRMIREILEEKGAHPEVLASASRKVFLNMVQDDPELDHTEDPIGNENLYHQEWFTPVAKAKK